MAIVLSERPVPVGTTESRIEESLNVEGVLHAIVSQTHGCHISQVEAARSSCGSGITHWEMAVAVRVATGRGNVGRVEDVGIDEIDLKAVSRSRQ